MTARGMQPVPAQGQRPPEIPTDAALRFLLEAGHRMRKRLRRIARKAAQRRRVLRWRVVLRAVLRW